MQFLAVAALLLSALAAQAAPAELQPASALSARATSQGDIHAYLQAHNPLRAKHGAKALKWDENLASKAHQWASRCQFKHSGGTLGPFGENLAAGTGNKYDIAAAVKSWADEARECSTLRRLCQSTGAHTSMQPSTTPRTRSRRTLRRWYGRRRRTLAARTSTATASSPRRSARRTTTSVNTRRRVTSLVTSREWLFIPS
jgi:hypothetical protein